MARWQAFTPAGEREARRGSAPGAMVRQFRPVGEQFIAEDRTTATRMAVARYGPLTVVRSAASLEHDTLDSSTPPPIHLQD